LSLSFCGWPNLTHVLLWCSVGSNNSERGFYTLQEAVRRLTSAPASAAAIKNRGTKGKCAASVEDFEMRTHGWPRQARDKYEENSNERAFFRRAARGWYEGRHQPD
jgi:hypothetical protein